MLRRGRAVLIVLPRTRLRFLVELILDRLVGGVASSTFP